MATWHAGEAACSQDLGLVSADPVSVAAGNQLSRIGSGGVTLRTWVRTATHVFFVG